MFDVGFTEIFLIGVVSLVVIGPERLPAVAKTAGQWVAKLQRFVRGVKTDLAAELETGDLKKLIGDQREQIDELRSMVTSASKDFQTTAQSVVSSTKESLSELETSVNEAKAEINKLDETGVDNAQSGEGSTASPDIPNKAATEDGVPSASVGKKAPSGPADSEDTNS